MVVFEFKDFNQLYHDLSRLPCLNYDKYKNEATKNRNIFKEIDEHISMLSDYAKDDTFYNFAPVGRIDGLIRDFDIDEVLFNYLKDEHMIMYSTDMAYLYGFNDKEGYDSYRQLSVHSPYKWAKKKARKLIIIFLALHI